MGIEHADDKNVNDAKGKGNTGEMSLEFLSKHPELAAEQLKITISKLQQIVSVSDRQELSKFAENPDNVTTLQGNMLKLLLEQGGEKAKNKG
jgi:hypothetical protein